MCSKAARKPWKQQKSYPKRPEPTPKILPKTLNHAVCGYRLHGLLHFWHINCAQKNDPGIFKQKSRTVTIDLSSVSHTVSPVAKGEPATRYWKCRVFYALAINFIKRCKLALHQTPPLVPILLVFFATFFTGLITAADHLQKTPTTHERVKVTQSHTHAVSTCPSQAFSPIFSEHEDRGAYLIPQGLHLKCSCCKESGAWEADVYRSSQLLGSFLFTNIVAYFS